ncbi:hypothetical protein FISHEDRAFT_57356 [Fistulina hepatica ATCC 64428]|uniref:Uncharacterized protein n=1 Tax=Fistulina hepatica ATCC 64428 TaxID=1128425 RepID=A0A0D7AHB6_9AGAR|nr:hypothetical protein FISHEDRAFT_57356 [Fistulina hepatica ATCC 64428]
MLLSRPVSPAPSTPTRKALRSELLLRETLLKDTESRASPGHKRRPTGDTVLDLSSSPDCSTYTEFDFRITSPHELVLKARLERLLSSSRRRSVFGSWSRAFSLSGASSPRYASPPEPASPSPEAQETITNDDLFLNEETLVGTSEQAFNNDASSRRLPTPPPSPPGLPSVLLPLPTPPGTSRHSNVNDASSSPISSRKSTPSPIILKRPSRELSTSSRPPSAGARPSLSSESRPSHDFGFRRGSHAHTKSKDSAIVSVSPSPHPPSLIPRRVSQTSSPLPSFHLPPTPATIRNSVLRVPKPRIPRVSPASPARAYPGRASVTPPCHSSARFNARIASRQLRECEGYVSFESVEGLGGPPIDRDDEKKASQNPKPAKKGWFW